MGGAQLWSCLSHQQRWNAAPSPSPSFPVRGRPAVFLDGQGFCDGLPADREKQGGMYRNWSSKQRCKGRIYARVPDRRAVTVTWHVMASAPGSQEAGSMTQCASNTSGYQKSWV